MSPVKIIATIAVIFLVVVGGAYFLLNLPPSVSKMPVMVKKSAHYESNTPEHGAVIPVPPVNVVIDFNFDLAPPSEIKIILDGKDYGVRKTIIDSNKLAMRREMDSSSPDGIYRVEYKACWPDGSCHDGHFEFAINHSFFGVPESHFDLRDRKEVLVSMQNRTFNPEFIRVRPGTKVFWKNEDSVDHYVNTDPHPAHTYFPKQNSKVLKPGEIFSLVFDKPGFYPYHCSAHAEIMTGWIMVTD